MLINSKIESSFRAWSPNIALEVRVFVTVFAGLRRRRFTVFWPFEIVIINNITFWSFQPNCMTFPSSNRLPYNLPHSRAEFHLVLSFRILSSRPRRDSNCSRCALIPSVTSRFSLFVVVTRTVPAASNPS